MPVVIISSVGWYEIQEGHKIIEGLAQLKIQPLFQYFTTM